jgi:hypothetical protein
MSKEPELPLPAWTAQLSRRELARLLSALLARVCRRCHSLGTVRTSRGALRYFRCRCGHRWKSCTETTPTVDANR